MSFKFILGAKPIHFIILVNILIIVIFKKKNAEREVVVSQHVREKETILRK